MIQSDNLIRSLSALFNHYQKFSNPILFGILEVREEVT
jgi:hypothetical protein